MIPEERLKRIEVDTIITQEPYLVVACLYVLFMDTVDEKNVILVNSMRPTSLRRIGMSNCKRITSSLRIRRIPGTVMSLRPSLSVKVRFETRFFLVEVHLSVNALHGNNTLQLVILWGRCCWLCHLCVLHRLLLNHSLLSTACCQEKGSHAYK